MSVHGARTSPRRMRLTKVPDRYVAVDTETNGDPAHPQAIEVAAVRMVNGEELATFSTLLKPDELPLPYGVEALCGITTAMLMDVPDAADVLDELLGFLGDDVVAGHNVAFDLRVLDALMARNGRDPLPATRVVDSLTLSRRAFPELPNHRLDTVFTHCQCVSWREARFHGTAHRALYDARMSAFALEVCRELGH
ncbi:3'-5' exonuclease [Olsenella sp. YH-ols2217]|uniref:3'-5' exonuclease n=1 Tax=Kribbibacterium absianum TaxID=3044210 RepID=A0ABT6ZNB8_9ACTN|nr:MULTISPECIES: 3'-5' exonuclease [unclassified Olsenella]MDJ1122287.1 3'-5' exonuclease [Olsenella sp. YH-ols2216]MDJ1130299.1 3'-5' exonuclease [Olsenella sp. YH-ols2217]